jgi:HlyD family secretion protein
MTAQSWPARRPIIIGMIGLSFLVGGFGTWATFAGIAGAVIAGGQIEVEQNRQVIQHPDGGVVSTIDVAEGDRVEVGQVLIRLDPMELASELTIVENQLFEMIARRGRLEAERDGGATIVFDPLLQEIAASRAEALELMDGQARLLEARRTTSQNEREQLNKRRLQIGDQIGGLAAQQKSLRRQAELIAEERAGQQILRDKGLTQTSRLLALQREEASLGGTLGDLIAQTAQAEGRQTEIDIELLKLDASLREEAITPLRDLQYRELELREKRHALSSRLNRLDITSPVSGVVYGLEVFAPRSVLRPAQPALYIVPQDRPLVISARVRTTDIDLVFPGQEVTLRFSALDQRTTPELLGDVRQISPDAFEDEATRDTYYRVRITLSKTQLARLPDGVTLVPGMPVEVFFQTGDRTPIAFLVKPLSDYFARAFRS